ncbi:MAG TPA: hypothetical protein VHM31_08270 [Polyangia bacterium]|nr:hypothetical protein [Polyangia bacterium]
MNTKTKNWAPICGTIALLAQMLVFPGCGGSNNPATGGTGTGGTTAGSTGGTTGSGTGGTTSTGTGGTTSPGTGGTTSPGTGGMTSSTGSAGASGFGSPACAATSTGAAVKKGGTCVAADPQLCYNTCGPEKAGVKSETCTGGLYAEGNCQFDPAKSYSCYKIPATEPAACPTTAIMAGTPCTIPDCTVCGATAGYLDSSMSPKVGYCVCQSGAANPTWSCATSTNGSWPCPAGNGC